MADLTTYILIKQAEEKKDESDKGRISSAIIGGLGTGGLAYSLSGPRERIPFSLAMTALGAARGYRNNSGTLLGGKEKKKG